MEKSRLARMNFRVFPLTMFAQKPEAWSLKTKKSRIQRKAPVRSTENSLPEIRSFGGGTNIPRLSAESFLRQRTPSDPPARQHYRPQVLQLSPRAKLTVYSPAKPTAVVPRLRVAKPPPYNLTRQPEELTSSPPDYRGMTLAEKLKHLQEIIEDQVLYADPHTHRLLKNKIL